MEQITVSKQIPGYTRKETLQNSAVCLLRHTLLRGVNARNLNFPEKSSENIKLYSFPLSLPLFFINYRASHVC